ncbi:MAG: DUF1080 domain-containing protein [Chitinophagales bacterium]
MIYNRNNALAGMMLMVATMSISFTPDHSSGESDQTRLNNLDLTSWINVPGATGNWTVRKNSLVCAGNPLGYLRSDRPYENFILDVECSGAADSVEILAYADALPAAGQPLPRAVECGLSAQEDQVRITALNGSKITSLPFMYKKGNHAPGKNKWNHFTIKSLSGGITISGNGRVLMNEVKCSLRKGYIAFVSGGYKTEFRNIRIRELPSTQPAVQEIAEADDGFRSLYDGKDLNNWNLRSGDAGHWTAQDWLIDYDGKSAEKDKCLWSKKEYADFVLIADVRLTRKPEMALSPVVLPNGNYVLNPDSSKKQVEVLYAGDTGIYLRGNSKSQVNIGYRFIGSGEIYGYRVDKSLSPEVRAGVTPKVKADNPPGEWNRFIITMQGERVTVVLNNITVIRDALLPGVPASGRLALQDDHADNNTFQFANLFIKELAP